MFKSSAVLFALMVVFAFSGVAFPSSPTILSNHAIFQDRLPLGTDEDKEDDKGEEGKMKEDNGDDKEEDKGKK